MKKIINLICEAKEGGLRVDIFINKREKLLSRTKIKNLILNGKLKLNDKIIYTPSKKVTNRDNIRLEIQETKKSSLEPYNFKLNIVFEDEDLIVINKPAGIIIHPGAGNYDKTIVNALMYYCGKNLSSIGDKYRPGIVHRIDKDTSGLVVVAKNNFCHENLSTQFNRHTIKRNYELLIWGILRP